MSDQISLLRHLAEAGLDFVIVGGYAGVVHGCSYVTQDIDICFVFDSANLLTLQNTLADLHPVHRMPPGRKPLDLTAESAAHFTNLYLDTDLGRLDCLNAIEGLGDYAQVKDASEQIDVAGLRLRVLTIDALIRTKQAMNRPRDREAIHQLEALKALRRGEPPGT